MERGGKQGAHTGTGAVYRIVVRDELVNIIVCIVFIVLILS
jgi:hypothetical protein